jgi:hypothetical protein
MNDQRIGVAFPLRADIILFFATSRLGGSLNCYPLYVVGFLLGVKLGGVKLTTSI